MCLKIINQINKLSKQEKYKKQMKKFALYETVRQLGYYNMIDPRARKLTGLSKKEYNYIKENYSKLVSKFPNIKERVKHKIEDIKSAKITKLDITKNDLCDNCKKL